MFGKTKMPAREEQHDRSSRYDSLAMIQINGFEGYAVLRNISTGGFCMESKHFVDIEADNFYSIQITPEKASAVSTFTLQVKARWIQSSAEKFSVGFEITQGGGRLEGYLNFLKNVRTGGYAA